MSSLYCFQLNVCEKGLGDDHILFDLHFTQPPNFCGIRVVKQIIRIDENIVNNI